MFAALAVALAIAAAARMTGVATVLGASNLAMVGLDALTMLQNSGTSPHLRMLEHYPSAGQQVRMSTARFGEGPAFQILRPPFRPTRAS